MYIEWLCAQEIIEQKILKRDELTVQLFTNTKNFLHITGHYLVYFIKFIIQLGNITLSSRVLVQFLSPLYECIYKKGGLVTLANKIGS